MTLGLAGPLTHSGGGLDVVTKAMELLDEVPSELILDLTEVEAIDSVGLGLLLVLASRINPGKLVLQSPSLEVAKVLHMAHFQDLLTFRGCPLCEDSEPEIDPFKRR